jgi:hypothetical protein
MDEDTLEACGRRLLQKSRAKTFAVLAADELEKISYNGPWDNAYIINTAKRHETRPKVQHWYGLYITINSRGRRVAELFCSYGKDPVLDYNFKIDLPIVFVNRISMQQATSSVCGLYALYFIYKRSRWIPARSISFDFSKENPKANDAWVVEFYNKIHVLAPSSGRKYLKCCTRLQNKL